MGKKRQKVQFSVLCYQVGRGIKKTGNLYIVLPRGGNLSNTSHLAGRRKKRTIPLFFQPVPRGRKKGQFPFFFTPVPTWESEGRKRRKKGQFPPFFHSCSQWGREGKKVQFSVLFPGGEKKEKKGQFHPFRSCVPRGGKIDKKTFLSSLPPWGCLQWSLFPLGRR